MVHYIWVCNGEGVGPQASFDQSSPASQSSSSGSEGRGPNYYYRKSFWDELSPTGAFGPKSPERSGSGPIPRAICKNCAHVFLCAYSPAGADFCSIDCRTSFDLSVEEEQQDMESDRVWAEEQAEHHHRHNGHQQQQHHNHYEDYRHHHGHHGHVDTATTSAYDNPMGEEDEDDEEAGYHQHGTSSVGPAPVAANGGCEPYDGYGGGVVYAPAPRASRVKVWAPPAATPDYQYYESAQLPSSICKSLAQRRGRSEWQQQPYYT